MKNNPLKKNPLTTAEINEIARVARYRKTESAPLFKPAGFYIWVELEEVEETTASGIVVATATEHKREQGGHDVAKVLGIGPTAHLGYEGIDGETAEERAAQWGYQVGDRVQITRYEGTEMRVPGHEKQRVIPDNAIRGVFSEE